MYFVISRIINISNFFLIGEYSPNAFKVNTDATTEYNRFRCVRAFECHENTAVNECSFTVKFSQKHLTLLKNLALWKVIFNVSETQIRIGHVPFNSKQTLDSFDVFFNNSCEQTFINLGICLHKNVSLMLHIKLLGFSIFDILKPNFTKHILRFLLLYRTPSSSATLFFW